MPTHSFHVGIWASIALAGLAHAHMAPFHHAMWALNGTVHGVVNYNNYVPVKPLYQLTYDQYWMHAVDGCNKFPPDDGVFLDLPAGKSFTMEIAENRAFTSLKPGAVVTNWGDGQHHPDNYSITKLGGLSPTSSGCIPSPNLHAQNQSMAAGTSFAISYESDITKVTIDNLVVFTVAYNTPYELTATYAVPSGMPSCPPGGCICTFNWIPNGCGQPNMYMFPYRCRVIPDSTPPKMIGIPKPARWCEDDPSQYVKGPKQIMIWNQAEKNNIEVSGNDLSGHPKSPAYNAKCGFKDGAQHDIFVESNVTQAPATSSQSKRMTRHREERRIF
ncbi:hypothetical protein V8E55_002421 [Tylopilus felleus]